MLYVLKISSSKKLKQVHSNYFLHELLTIFDFHGNLAKNMLDANAFFISPIRSFSLLNF